MFSVQVQFNKLLIIGCLQMHSRKRGN